MDRTTPPKKIELFVTSADGQKTKIFESYLPFFSLKADYPTNSYYVMGKMSPIVEHSGQVNFTLQGSGQVSRPRKPKKQKPLSKRALKKLEEEDARLEAEQWADDYD